MKRPLVLNLLTCFVAIAAVGQRTIRGQSQPPPDHPSITVRGQTYTPRSILARNMGTPEDQSTPFPPHKIIGNIYYLGTRTLTSFLIATPQGAIHDQQNETRKEGRADFGVSR
jgi:metallo-beta-lactamase class B